MRWPASVVRCCHVADVSAVAIAKIAAAISSATIHASLLSPSPALWSNLCAQVCAVTVSRLLLGPSVEAICEPVEHADVFDAGYASDAGELAFGLEAGRVGRGPGAAYP
jgi:hypothetical protein